MYEQLHAGLLVNLHPPSSAGEREIQEQPYHNCPLQGKRADTEVLQGVGKRWGGK